MKKIKYRIIKSTKGQFRVQYKKWFFWHDTNTVTYAYLDHEYPIIYDTEIEARDEIKRHAASIINVVSDHVTWTLHL